MAVPITEVQTHVHAQGVAKGS